MKFTPENIRHLEPNQIFVYGANAAGIHGAGAAKLALRWGAKMGQYGFNGQTYGIPTKDRQIYSLPLNKIQSHVNTFLAFAFTHPEYEFLVTKNWLWTRKLFTKRYCANVCNSKNRSL